MVNIYIGGSKVDQYKDEAVDIVSSVLDVSDITKNTGDYSKTFTVPASKTNNKLFKHWYNANIDNGFDARTKVDGVIDIDGIPFKKGKFRLYKVNVKKGVATSYTINFFGNLLDISDTLGDDELSVLDLTAYNHDYNSDNVSTGLSTSGLFSRDIIYTLQSNKRYFFDSNPLTPDFSETQINIANDGGGTGVVWNDLKPSLKLIRIIEAIESYYSVANGFENPIKFSREFFDTTEFNELYMLLNPSTETPAGGLPQIINWDSGTDGWMDLVDDTGMYEVSNTAASDDDINFLLETIIIPSAGYEDVPYEYIIYSGDEEYSRVSGLIGGSINETILSNVDSEVEIYTIQYAVKSVQEFKYTASLKQVRFGSGTGFTSETEEVQASENTTQSVFTVSEQIPELKIIDFLKGLFNMFKLVVVPQDDGTLYVNTLKQYYNDGNRYDITKYIDNEKIEIKRGDILNEIDIQFQESDTILAEQFRNVNNRGYGDSLVKLLDSYPNGKLLDGESLTMELPFELFVYERLRDKDTNVLTNIATATIADNDLESVTHAPNIHYSSIQVPNGSNFAFVDDLGSRDSYTLPHNVPSHTYTMSSALYSTLFEAEFSTWDYVKVNNTLYKNHYEDYVKAIFNIKRRTFVYKAVLPIWLTTTLKLNDVVSIESNDYRINKYSYNLLNGVTTLELINGFQNDLGSLFTIPNYINLDNNSHTLTYNLPNASDYVVTTVDTGYGVGWFTIVINRATVVITVTENTAGNTRNAGIYFTYNSVTNSVLLKQIQ